jgi:hypothetical protein
MYDELYTINLKSLDKVKEYVDFIESCKGLELPDYTEKHHILPKSLFPKYEFDKDNLIELSAINHYKAHVLLAEAYGDGMLYALRMMDSRYSDDNIPEINYELFREEFSKRHSDVMKEVWNNAEFRNKMSISHNKAWKNNQERKENISNKMSEKWSDPAYKEEISKAIREATQTEEFRSKISDISKEQWTDNSIREKRLQGMAITMQTAEYKKKHSDNQKIRMQDPELRAKCGWRKGLSRPAKTCPWCNQTHNTLGFFNTHFENCRNKKDLAKRYLRVSCILNIFNNLDIKTKSQLSKYELTGKEKERRINFMFYKTPNLIGTQDFYNYINVLEPIENLN